MPQNAAILVPLVPWLCGLVSRSDRSAAENQASARHIVQLIGLCCDRTLPPSPAPYFMPSQSFRPLPVSQLDCLPLGFLVERVHNPWSHLPPMNPLLSQSPNSIFLFPPPHPHIYLLAVTGFVTISVNSAPISFTLLPPMPNLNFRPPSGFAPSQRETQSLALIGVP